MQIKKERALGIVCGVVCALSVLLYTQSVQGQVEQARAEALAHYGGEQVEVCVAARDIAAGETIDSSALTTELWVASLLPPGAQTDPRSLTGKQVTSPIYKGEVVLSKRFGSLDFSFNVPDNLVALSVSAKEVQAVGGALKPGSYVDVYAAGQSSTSLIAESVLVLATSAYEGDGSSSGAALTWVALGVKPDYVEEIIAAQQKTQLYFALPAASSEKEVRHE